MMRQRLRASNGFADTPSAEDVAAQQTPAQARATYGQMARMVADAGFNFNFGPVVDLRGDPADPLQQAVSPVIGKLKRAYSNDPATVVRYAETFIQAHHEAGVLTALKHWPGHGLATGDTHLGLVDVTQTAQPIEQWPFQQLIRSGNADAVMTAHLVNRSVDPDWPVTLSQRFIQPLLRARRLRRCGRHRRPAHGRHSVAAHAPRSGGARHPGGQRLAGVIEQPGRCHAGARFSATL